MRRKKTIVKKKEQVYFDCMIAISLMLTLTFICFVFQGADKIYCIRELREQSTYTVQKTIDYSRKEDTPVAFDTTVEYEKEWDKSNYDDYLEKLRGIETGNLFMSLGTYIRLGKAGLNSALDVLITQNEPLKYPLKSGRYWEDGSDNQDTVIIGIGVLKSTYLKGEKRYLLINDEPYEVIGILEDVTGNQTDSRIFVNYQWISNDLKDNLSYNGSDSLPRATRTFFVSEYSDVDKELAVITEWYGQYYPALEVSIKDMLNDWDFDVFMKLLKYFISGLLIFALYNSCIVAKLLFERYKKDLIIMRTFGLGDGKIIWYFYHKIWLCYGIGILGALLVFRKLQLLLPAAGLFFLFMLTTIAPIVNILRSRSIRKIGTNLFEVI